MTRVGGQHRSTQRHTPASQTVEDPDAALRAWLREYAGKHPRWGHRRAYHDARGEGRTVSHKKIQRLWREEGLRVVVKRRRKRVGSSTVPPVPSATGPNMVWAIDFQFDSTTDGRPVKILSVVDEHTRECLGLRDECLNIHLFWSLTHAKVTIGDWKEEYNHDRLHSSLGYRTPRAYAAICTH